VAQASAKGGAHLQVADYSLAGGLFQIVSEHQRPTQNIVWVAPGPVSAGRIPACRLSPDTSSLVGPATAITSPCSETYKAKAALSLPLPARKTIRKASTKNNFSANMTMTSGASQNPHLDLSFGMVLRIFLPFACGYSLSYLFRTVNAVIAPNLVQALNLNATDLGLLTSVYFLAFALTQIPLGILLDRFGPRRVEALLLLFAAAGALVFARSAEHSELVLGRALIGLGVSACLMAAFKAFVAWFPRERLPAINGTVLAAGGLGAIAASAPVEAALQLTDWRGLFLGLSAATFLVAAAIFLLVPDHPAHLVQPNLRTQLKEVVSVFRNPRFWQIALLSMLTQATFMSIQSLWAGPWLKDVAGLSRVEVANHLFVMAVGMITGYLFLGNLAPRLSRHGIHPVVLARSGMFVFMMVQLAITVGLTLTTQILFFLFGFFGTSGSLSYAILSQAFPTALAGRVNTALNLLVFASTFICQWGIGAVINLWPSSSGGYSSEGYRTAFGSFLALQASVFAWLFFAERRRKERELIT
jgi:sugar phosphate permease